MIERIPRYTDKQRAKLVNWITERDLGRCTFIHGILWLDTPDESLMFTNLKDLKEYAQKRGQYGKIPSILD